MNTTINKLIDIIKRLIAARDNCEHHTRAETIARLDARQALAEMKRDKAKGIRK